MQAGETGNQAFVADFTISGKTAVRDHDHTVTHNAVMSNVCICHEETSISDHRFCTHMSTAVDRHIFPELVIVADSGVRRTLRRIIRIILRIMSDGRKRVNHIIFAHSGIGCDVTLSEKACTVPDSHMVINDTVRSNLHIFTELDILSDHSGGMYSCHTDQNSR